MTILDDLFSEASGLWTIIQGTADKNQQVKVDAAMPEVVASDLKEPLRPPFVKHSDTLIYNPRTLATPASFVGSELTILAPGHCAVPSHNPADATVVDSPDYGILSANARPPTSTAATDETGKFVYFPLGEHEFVAVTLANLRSE